MSELANNGTTEDGRSGEAPVGRGDYEVVAGDCLSSIAARFGLRWQVIWDHPENAELKRLRKNPNVLLPGDRITIPRVAAKWASGEAGGRHCFVVKTPEITLLRLVLRRQGQPVSNAPFVLSINGSDIKGRTNADGKIEVRIPATAGMAELTVGEDPASLIAYRLQLGGVDPIEALTGIQQRLRNLGFDCGAVDGIFGPKTRSALSAFQKSAGREPTGRLDAQTIQLLNNAHGS